MYLLNPFEFVSRVRWPCVEDCQPDEEEPGRAASGYDVMEGAV